MDGAQIIDVRSPAEFATGANPKSINIPLDRLEKEAASLDRKQKIVLCCASGMRSGMAVSILQKLGFENVTNGGPWTRTLS